jgi:hypothetical protein
MRWAALLAGLTLLAGCAPQAPPAPPATPTAAGAAAPARGVADFTVRTAARAPSGVDLEVRGVECVATSGAATTAFRSPARVVLPDVGQGVRVACAGGGRSGEAVVEARQAFQRGGWRAAPSIGVSIGAGGGRGTRVGTGLGVNVAPVAVPAGVAYDDVRVVLR